MYVYMRTKRIGTIFANLSASRIHVGDAVRDYTRKPTIRLTSKCLSDSNNPTSRKKGASSLYKTQK